MPISQKSLGNQKIFETELNTSTYADYRHREEDYFRSELYYLRNTVPRIKTLLDIGSSCGGFFNICRQWNENIQYSGLEMNLSSVGIANEKYGTDQRAKFIIGQFPEAQLDQPQYDLVNMFEIIFFAADWKVWIDALIAKSRQYTTFTNRVRLSGTTVLDPAVSYARYLRGDEIIPYFIFNLDEFLNYLKHPKHALKSISVFGYPMPHNPYLCLPLPSSEVYCTALLLEKGVPEGPFAEVDINIERGPA
jgi:hypothetical protein